MEEALLWGASAWHFDGFRADSLSGRSEVSSWKVDCGFNIHGRMLTATSWSLEHMYGKCISLHKKMANKIASNIFWTNTVGGHWKTEARFHTYLIKKIQIVFSFSHIHTGLKFIMLWFEVLFLHLTILCTWLLKEMYYSLTFCIILSFLDFNSIKALNGQNLCPIVRRPEITLLAIELSKSNLSLYFPWLTSANIWLEPLWILRTLAY